MAEIQKEDYEPQLCSCGNRGSIPGGRINLMRVRDRLDELEAAGNPAGAVRLLDYWLERRLASRGLPNELENYYSPDTVGRKTESAIDRRRRKRAEKRKNHLASEDTGSGDLNLRERVRLRTYQIARKYHVFSDGTEEDLAAFLEEEKAMVREHTPDESAGETPAPVKEGLLEEILAEPAETPAPTEEGKGDGDHE